MTGSFIKTVLPTDNEASKAVAGRDAFHTAIISHRAAGGDGKIWNSGEGVRWRPLPHFRVPSRARVGRRQAAAGCRGCDRVDTSCSLAFPIIAVMRTTITNLTH